MGSNPTASLNDERGRQYIRFPAVHLLAELGLRLNFLTGGVPERPKGPDCKSGGNAFAGSNPAPPIGMVQGWGRDAFEALWP